ncbi:MAG: efflux RND transporter periplasmic adaptor subunit [Bacteroidales bacterium]|nr:efflux RND transporter periplasmic adaptor subunit [Bacteroidales bacterium]
MKKATKTILWLVVAALVIAVALLLLLNKKEKPVLTYQVTTLAPTTISSSVTATGTVEPVKQVEVGTQVSGIISKIYVDYNSVVKEGQLIAELDMSVLKTELESSRANLNSAKVEYDYQQRNYDRIKGLYDKELVSATEFEQAQYSYDKARFSYSQAQSNYTKAQKNIGYAKIYSPIDGVVLSRAVDEGQTVASGFSTPTLFTIANDLTAMRVIANVDEADIGAVQEGQRVEFEVDAYPEDTFQGSVTQVRLQATTTSNVVTYQVVIDAPNPSLKLKPGLTANITIYTLDKHDVLAVPVRALRFTPEGEKYQENTVWKQLPDGRLEATKVVTGVTDGVQTEILEGLGAGDRVVTGTRLVTSKGKEFTPEFGKEGQQPGGNNPFMPRPPQDRDNKRTE